MYAVIDLETTGLYNRDRVVEVAIVHADEHGEITGRWHTLVNPERDLGRQDVHGVRAADARRAPRFADIAGDIAVRMAGRIPVVHNISFDSRLLSAEYARLGLGIPHLAEYGVCTMSWAAEYLPGNARSLADCRAAIGLTGDRPHEALDDALATAALLRVYIRRAGYPPPWAVLATTAASMRWPGLPHGLVAERHRSLFDVPGEFLTRIPRAREGPPGDPVKYLTAVDIALLDGCVSASEADQLVEIATGEGFDRDHVLGLHRAYLRGLVAQGVGRADLAERARLLGLPTVPASPAEPITPRFALRPGDVVVLTGSFAETKEYWAEVAEAAGLSVAGHVSRRTAMVVAADPDSMSGKATTARRYGIPVVAVEGMLRAMSAGFEHAGGQAVLDGPP
ncbi:exonuclease domain-containing protein [Phytomonospora sp. NPDC050363]|uniref:exonuclease domain-containing protein n=1 Tax=Phytomonospora sp. NPDC050363 TaxID=3155642 RepID=UPI0033FE0C3F